jgi:hypothetical protein
MSASNSIVQTPTIKVLDPRIDIAKQREYVITKGGNKVSYISYKSNSTGNNAMQFSVIPGSRQTIIDRAMYVQATIQCTFTATLSATYTAVLLPPATNPSGATVAQSLVHPGFDAPRSFPLSRALASATLQIGNTSLSMNTGEVIDPLLRVMDKNDLRFDMCPSALDRSQRYEENAGYLTGNANPSNQSSFGWGSNVLSTTQNFLADGQLPRGCYNLQVNNPVVAGQNITQVVTFQVMEPVMLSPLCYEKLHSGLIGLQNINLLYNFSPSASQLVWSGTPKFQYKAGPSVIALPVTNTVSFNTSNAMLWVGFISPSPLMSIPAQVSYAYDEIQCYTTQNLNAITYNGWLQNTLVPAGATYNGASQQVSTNNIQLKVVPSRILIGVRPQLSQMTYQDPHSYFQINGCSINFDNGVGILSSCLAEELYNISKKNGLNYDYASWLGEYDTYKAQTDPADPLASGTVPLGFNNWAHGTGSLLVFDPAVDFGLADGLAAGVSGSYNFQVTLNVKCINSKFSAGSSAYEIFVIVVNDGSVSIDCAGTGAVASQIGLISSADVLTAPLDVNVDYNELKGNGWLSSIKHFAKKAIPIIKDVAPHAMEIFNKTKSHLENSGSALIGSGVGRGVGRGGKLSKLSLKDRLN